MIFSKTKSLTLMALLSLVANTAFGAIPQGQEVNALFETILKYLNGASIAVVTIALLWAGYKVLFQGNTIQEIAKPLLGAVLIGSAPWIAQLLLGGN